ncbi:hypothetical protein KGA66_25290 [Actinocrinis puniceicyclus]|uniref:Uncharacterized protein n=1 Tax=Actinocrinis puniceicyclus TaxID=977794 RepID=A0A8J8BFP7_9ACTN|nr:hypothetical protein [Actinocrinis puniceicyclus]MBS2966381.1 hypothetical protein [Actinocrinis puniceicyclus]
MSDLSESHLAMARIIDALFCSELETGDVPTGRQLAHAIRGSLKTHRNWNGCTRAVAEAFAKTPAEASRREEWCRQLAESALSSTVVGLTLGDFLA